MGSSGIMKGLRGMEDSQARSNPDDDLIIEERLRPEALATLRTNRSLDKMVKSYVRKPISNKNLQPKHLLYKPPVPAPNVFQSTSSMPDLVPDFAVPILRRGSCSSTGSMMSSHPMHPTTDYVGIGVGGGEGVELSAISKTMSMSHSATPGLIDSRCTSGDTTENPLPTKPASPLLYIAQPNHNNGSPRSPKRSDNFLPIWNDISSPTDFPPAPGRVDVRGAQIPAVIMKEGMIDLVRKHDTAQRKRFAEQKKQAEEFGKQLKPEVGGGTAIVDSATNDIIKFMKKGEMGFEDSFDSNIDDLSFGMDKSFSMTESSQREIKTSKSYMDLTQKSKLSSIARIEDDYAAKWMKMKVKRDERREREIRRAARAQIMQTFSQVVYNTERNEIQRALLNKKEESNERPEHKEEIRNRRRMQEETLRRRFEAEKKRKKEEVQKIKEAIKSTMQMSSAIKANMLSEKREKVKEMSFVLDDASSSIISVPSDMSTRLKTATSLKAYESAKKDIKDYQESTLSNRFAALAKSKGDALSRVASLGSGPMTLTPLKTSVFSDSITLHSDASFYLPSASSKVSSAVSAIHSPKQNIRRDVVGEQQMTDSINDDASFASNSSISSRGSPRSIRSRDRESTRDRQFKRLQEQYRQEDLHAAANRQASQRVALEFERKIEDFGTDSQKKKGKKFHPDWPRKFQLFGENNKERCYEEMDAYT